MIIWGCLHIANPKKIAIVTYAPYVWQNGVSDTAIVDITKQMLLTNNALTDGKSAKYPQAIRPTVLVIPIMDKRKEALLLSIP